MGKDSEEHTPLRTRLLNCAWILFAIPICMVFWLVLIAPLVPATKAGWPACAGACMAVFLWLGLGTFIHARFECQIRPRRLYMAIAALLIVATGGGMIWAYIANQDFIASNFSYWHF